MSFAKLDELGRKLEALEHAAEIVEFLEGHKRLRE